MDEDYSIWIEAEGWAPGEWTPTDDVTDVVVTREDGTRWVASFCAYAHVETLRQNCRESGENLGGAYLWASDLVLVESTARQTVERVVRDLMEADEFESAFSEVAEEDDEGGPTFERGTGPQLLS